MEINRAFAGVVAETIKDEKRPVIILPQDYHLYLLPYYLRELLGERVQIQPFIHIPWPGPDAWRILPNRIRKAILTGLLQADRVGFQTQKDAFNFVETCRFYLEDAHSRGSRNTVYYNDHVVKAIAYPISIDTQKLQSLVEEPQTHLLKSQLYNKEDVLVNQKDGVLILSEDAGAFYELGEHASLSLRLTPLGLPMPFMRD